MTSKRMKWLQRFIGVTLLAGCGAEDVTEPGDPATTAAAAVPCAAGATVGLFAKGNGRYVTADLRVNGTPLLAQADHNQQWEQYQLVDAGGGQVALRASANGRYVSADLNHGGAVVAGWATKIQGWEQFRLVPTGDGWYGLRSSANGYYVSADLNQGGALRAAWATKLQDWEKFQCASIGGGGGGTGGDLIGYYAQTWLSSATPPAGVNVGVAFSGEINVDSALSTSAAVLGRLRGAAYISLGGGDASGRWDRGRLDAITAALRAGRFGQYRGIVYDVEEGDAGLADAFRTSFAAAKAAGKQVVVTISHSAPYGISDAPALIRAFVQDPNIDYLSPQLYTSGAEGQNDFGTSYGVAWSSYRGMKARLAPSIVAASYYANARQFFAGQGLTTAGFIQWKNN